MILNRKNDFVVRIIKHAKARKVIEQIIVKPLEWLQIETGEKKRRRGNSSLS